MIKRYITDQNIIHEADEFQPGVWVALTSPTAEECTLVADTYGIDPADVRAALDDEESSRVEQRLFPDPVRHSHHRIPS